MQVVLQQASLIQMIEDHGHQVVADTARQVIDEVRQSLLKGEAEPTADCVEAVADRVRSAIQATLRPQMQRAVNATGIILHTGLGRAVMPDTVRDALMRVVGYCNIQTDLESGKRAKREQCVAALVKKLTGAEEMLLVNNNAGATLLVLRALAAGKEVVVSRGELIEIGGAFRLPDVMAESAATMREVGTTNKTHLRDYEGALGPNTALIFKANMSNYKIIGFTKEVGIEELAPLAHQHGIPLVHDLGCGALVDLGQYGLEPELSVQQSLALGSDVVLFSTDKLIGGPQGGLVVGKKVWLDRIRSHPLYRALRVCKLTLAALEATLKLFEAPEHLVRDHPTYAIIAKPVAVIEAQARQLAAELAQARPEWTVSVTSETAYLGGGSSPGSALPSFGVRLSSPSMPAEAIAHLLRTAEVPILARIHDDDVILDMRTVFASELPDIAAAVDGPETPHPEP